MNNQRHILCIDLKSFFASCECVERGLDPFTTPLVVADPDRGDGAITLAVTPKMKEYGVSMYNFVGCRINVDKDSKQAGIQSFKERFGGQLVNCFLFKTVFHPFKKTIYDFLINTFRKGGDDILEQELHKWAELQRL